MMAGGCESMLLAESLAIESEQVLPVERSLEEQLADAEIIIAWLEKVSKDKETIEYIGEKTWSDFVDKIYDWLDTLEFDVKSKE